MKICIVYNAHPTGCSLYRLELPNAHLAEKYPEFDFVSVADLATVSPAELSTVDLFVVNRFWLHGTPDLVQQVYEGLTAFGAKVLYDIDDYWVLESGHPFYKDYTERKTAETIRAHIRLADVVTCSTKHLAEKIYPLNKNVVVLPNCPFLKYAQYTPDPSMERDTEIVKFGWFGAAQHQEDIQVMQSGLDLLGMDRSLDGKYKLYLGGWAAGHPTYADYERMMSWNGKNPNYGRINAADIYSYVTGYNYINVALAPLRDTTFNKLKSELKIVEAGYMKKPIICSDLIPYSDVIKHGQNGFLVPHKKPRNWYKHIRDLMHDKAMVAEMGAALQADVLRDFDMDRAGSMRAAIYKTTGRKPTQ